MCKDLYSVWCEYDIGQNGLVFTSKEDAEYFIKNNEAFLSEELGEDVDLMKEGLANIIRLRVWREDETK